MRVLTMSLLVLMTLSLSGCGNSAVKAQKRAYRAQESVAKERLELVDRYQTCVQKAGSDQIKSEACETYLRAAEALK